MGHRLAPLSAHIGAAGFLTHLLSALPLCLRLDRALRRGFVGLSFGRPVDPISFSKKRPAFGGVLLRSRTFLCGL